MKINSSLEQTYLLLKIYHKMRLNNSFYYLIICLLDMSILPFKYHYLILNVMRKINDKTSYIFYNLLQSYIKHCFAVKKKQVVSLNQGKILLPLRETNTFLIITLSSSSSSSSSLCLCEQVKTGVYRRQNMISVSCSSTL